MPSRLRGGDSHSPDCHRPGGGSKCRRCRLGRKRRWFGLRGKRRHVLPRRDFRKGRQGPLGTHDHGARCRHHRRGTEHSLRRIRDAACLERPASTPQARATSLGKSSGRMNSTARNWMIRNGVTGSGRRAGSTARTRPARRGRSTCGLTTGGCGSSARGAS